MQGPERYGWSESTHDRPKVLIEHPDPGVGFVAQRVLEREGFDVATCEGSRRYRPCPLVHGQHCTLAAQADVVVHALDDDRPDPQAVLDALRANRPEVPIVLEVPRRALALAPALYEGSHAIDFPMTRESLVEAVKAAASAAPPSETAVDVDRRSSWLVKNGDVIDCPKCGELHVVSTHRGEPPMQVVRCRSGTWPVGIENRRIPFGRGTTEASGGPS